MLNQVPPNAGEDYGYYTRNYDYYAARPRAGKRPAGAAETGDAAPDRLRLREDDRG